MEISLVLIVVVLCSTAATLVTCSSAGFHMELTHVDGKGSYTTAERVQRAMASSRQRLASFADVSVPIHWNTSQYIAEYLIGNPPQCAEAIVDTASDLIWTQCSTCSLKGSCVMQGLPYYKASKSDSFHLVACNDTLCLANLEHSCARGGSCAFGAFYGVGVARGSIGTEVGVKKFSYCHTASLRSNATASANNHLSVSASASLSGGSPVMSMSFAQVPKKYPFYYVPLIGISVGQTRLSIPPTVFAPKQNGSGGFIIDSGNPTTALAHGAPEAGEREPRVAIRKQWNEPVYGGGTRKDSAIHGAPLQWRSGHGAAAGELLGAA
ncbi:hypothetical protein VPH35_056102 [Triticum aestivum]|uniref:Peptidase A1 domain-containing protein n=2 Tax=Triticum TaxID=4564 RepID=A0A9R1QZR0_TRITD|nr:unnamed protein product [Triticum aestivum]VAH85502.1 unnamed protein product [Triticum turgidum subsp. durum]